MGGKQSGPRTYAKFEGVKKEGESRILKHVMDILKPTDPTTMLEEFM